MRAFETLERVRLAVVLETAFPGSVVLSDWF